MSLDQRFTSVALVMRRGDDEPRLALIDTAAQQGPCELDLTDPNVMDAIAHVLSTDSDVFDDVRRRLVDGSPF